MLVVSAGIFYYYLQDVRNLLTTKNRNALRAFSVVLIIGSIVCGFLVIGSPRTQKHQKQDQDKVNNLSTIQSQVISYYQSHGALPTTLEAMQNSLSYYTLPKDAQTGKNYEYRVTGANTFDLCAVFNTNPQATKVSRYAEVAPNYVSVNSNWQYTEGPFCFHRTLDPQLYPVYSSAYTIPTIPVVPTVPVVVPKKP